MARRAILISTLLLGSWATAETSITEDVIYGHKDGMALTYDVFTPDTPNGAGILYMVSGGWFSRWRPPEERMDAFEPLLDAGFSVFAIHHGSAPRYKVPDAVSDVRAAVRHVKSNAREYGIDTGRLGVWGGSAGGHLSLVLGLAAEAEPVVASGDTGQRLLAPVYHAERTANASVAAIVAYFPPVDLRPLAGPSDRFPSLNFSPDEAAAVSPILHVTEDDPPTLLIHGDADDLVPLSASASMQVALDEAGVTNELIVIEGGDHGFRNPGHRSRATQAMVSWFTTHLYQ